jgi:hypothetical protein
MLITDIQTGLTGEHQSLFPSTSFPLEGPTNVWLEKMGYRVKDKSDDILAIEIRVIRDELLSDTDKLGLTDRPTMSNEYVVYRQDLRDITDQLGFPYSVTFPTKPE